ncbi:MAG: transposase [Candidatus Bathyarchaeia archaeon]|nr:transposase [Candidatus Bathyarchaeia archaeon]
MYLTAKIPELTELKEVGNICTKIWNKANYFCRQQWEQTGKIPSYYELQRVFKDDFWCRQVHSHTAQAVLHKLSESYRSWFQLRKVDATANPPSFRKKSSVSTVTFTKFAITIRDAQMELTLKKGMHVCLSYQLQPKVKITEKNVVRVEVKNGFANIVYRLEEPPLQQSGQVMGIDLGVINTATTVKENGEARIYTGKSLLSTQRYFNKEICRVQSIVMAQSKGKKKWSRRLSELSRKRTRQIRHVLHAQTKAIVDDCIKSNVNVVVAGDLHNIRKLRSDTRKHEKLMKARSWGRVNNQKNHAWSFSWFTATLAYKLRREGILSVQVNERGTSKTCCRCGEVRKRNRKTRGLYICNNCGLVMNADVNGAVNILETYLRPLGRSSANVNLAKVIKWDKTRLSLEALPFKVG